MRDMVHYRKAIENIIEDARANGIEVKLEKNSIDNVEIMIADPKTSESCRVRKLQLCL